MFLRNPVNTGCNRALLYRMDGDPGFGRGDDLVRPIRMVGLIISVKHDWTGPIRDRADTAELSRLV